MNFSFLYRKSTRPWIGNALSLIALLTAIDVSAQERRIPSIQIEDLLALPEFPGELGPLPLEESSPDTRSRAALGKILFFDVRLSKDQTVSCATCHQPDLAWTDGRPVAKGIAGTFMTRNTPTVLNSTLLETFFWDGRTSSITEQVKGPLISVEEHGFDSEEAFTASLKAIPFYVEQFETVFGRSPNLQDTAQAIVAFEKTLVTPNSRFDQFMMGNHEVLTDLEKQGLTLFVSKASCTLCHVGPIFSDNNRHNVTSKSFAARTPGLRNVGVTAPYMHDGEFGTLTEVVEFYNRGGDHPGEQSPLLFPLGLSDGEVEALVAFLYTLTGKIEDVEMPTELRDVSPTMPFPPASAVDFVPVPPSTFDTTKELMASGIHEQFSFLGFNIWHTPELHKKNRDMIAKSAISVEKLATQSIRLFSESPASKEKQEIFRTGMKSLSAISSSLAQSARFGSRAEVINQFTRMEQSCNACHGIFRPDLVWTAHHGE